jgi:hypothetical protein
MTELKGLEPPKLLPPPVLSDSEQPTAMHVRRATSFGGIGAHIGGIPDEVTPCITLLR